MDHPLISEMVIILVDLIKANKMSLDQASEALAYTYEHVTQFFKEARYQEGFDLALNTTKSLRNKLLGCDGNCANCPNSTRNQPHPVTLQGSFLQPAAKRYLN